MNTADNTTDNNADNHANPSDTGSSALAPIVITTGEPAGIGPELALRVLRDWQAYPQAHPQAHPQTHPQARTELKLIGDWPLLAAQALAIGYPLRPEQVLHTPVQQPVRAGTLNPANATYVLSTLDMALEAVSSGKASAMVTCPVHKGVINQAGIAFTGHTEYLADATDTEQVVMLLADTQAKGLKVALATTHLPLSAVPAAITQAGLLSVMGIIDEDLRRWFGITQPNIWVTGLNPHAGEGGHLGREEIDVIEPAIAAAQAHGLWVSGPYPADTLFCHANIAQADVVLAMYHDQGLPVLKYASFGHAVNVTLGLPIIRTSVDHGTALDLVGTGKADAGSLMAAVLLAQRMALADKGILA